jgi:hypothetical protein
MKATLRKALFVSSGLVLMFAALSTLATAQLVQELPGPHRFPLQILPDCEKEGQIISLKLNTGTGTGMIGAQDPHWTVSGGGTAPYAYSTNIATGWVQPSGSAVQWIQPATGGNAFDFPNSGTYKYTTRFVVSPLMYLLGGITVSGKFSADNSAILKVNGKPIAGISCVGSSLGTCFKQYTNFSIPSTYIQSGINEITVEVTNNDIYTGLIVESSVVSNCKKCEPPRKR